MPQDNPDPQVVPYLLYADAGAAMDWLIKVFAFTERERDKNSDGTVRHAELLLDNGGVIMLGSPGLDFRGPAKLGEVTQLQCITITNLPGPPGACTRGQHQRVRNWYSGEPCTRLHSGRSRGSSLVLQRGPLGRSFAAMSLAPALSGQSRSEEGRQAPGSSHRAGRTSGR